MRARGGHGVPSGVSVPRALPFREVGGRGGEVREGVEGLFVEFVELAFPVVSLYSRSWPCRSFTTSYLVTTLSLILVEMSLLSGNCLRVYPLPHPFFLSRGLTDCHLSW